MSNSIVSDASAEAGTKRHPTSGCFITMLTYINLGAKREAWPEEVRAGGTFALDPSGEKATCIPCDVVVNARRSFSAYYLKDHMRSQRHIRKMATWRESSNPRSRITWFYQSEPAPAPSSPIASGCRDSLDITDDVEVVADRRFPCPGVFRKYPDLIRLYETYGTRNEEWATLSFRSSGPDMAMSAHVPECKGKARRANFLSLPCELCDNFGKPRSRRDRLRRMETVRDAIDALGVRGPLNIQHLAALRAHRQIRPDYNDSRKSLCNMVKAFLDLQDKRVTISTHLANKNINVEITCDDDFLNNFKALYSSHAEIKNSLLSCMLRMLLIRSTRTSAPLEILIVDFYMMLSSYGRSVYKFVAGNLPAPSFRHIQRLSASSKCRHSRLSNLVYVLILDLASPIIDITPDALSNRVNDFGRRILESLSLEERRRHSDRITVTLSMDATKVAPAFLLSVRHGVAVGRISPEHMLSVTSTEEFSAAVAKDFELATEIKVNSTRSLPFLG